MSHSSPMQLKEFFISEGAMRVFAANHTDGRVRSEMLGITEKCYHDKDEADIWIGDVRNEISRARNLCGDVETQAALEKVESIYSRMTGLVSANNGEGSET